MWILRNFEREFIYIEFYRAIVLGFQIKLPICSKTFSRIIASSGFRFRDNEFQYLFLFDIHQESYIEISDVRGCCIRYY